MFSVTEAIITVGSCACEEKAMLSTLNVAYFLSSKINRELEELLEESSVEATTITTTEGEVELAQAMVCPREGTGPRLLAMELLQEEEEE